MERVADTWKEPLTDYVNVLSGVIVRVGKSTILRWYEVWKTAENFPVIHIKRRAILIRWILPTPNGSCTLCSFWPTVAAARRHHLCRHRTTTELDWQLFQRGHLDYQVNVGNRRLSRCSGNSDAAHAQALAEPKRLFQHYRRPSLQRYGQDPSSAPKTIRCKSVTLSSPAVEREKQMPPYSLTVLRKTIKTTCFLWMGLICT